MRGVRLVLAALAFGCGDRREDGAAPATGRAGGENAEVSPWFVPPPVREAGGSPPAGKSVSGAVAVSSASGSSAAGGWSAEDCTNGSDDDGDGLVDCEDGECLADAACAEDCANGTDDDGDGLADCDDGACAGDSACSDWEPVRVHLGGYLHLERNQTASGAGTCQARMRASGGGLTAVDGSTACSFSKKGWLTWTMSSAASTSLCENFSFFTRPAVWGTPPTLSSGCSLSPAWSDLAPGVLMPRSINPLVNHLSGRDSFGVGAFPGTAATFSFTGTYRIRSFSSNRGGVAFTGQWWASGVAWTVPARVVR